MLVANRGAAVMQNFSSYSAHVLFAPDHMLKRALNEMSAKAGTHLI
jgi:hypothetical protein